MHSTAFLEKQAEFSFCNDPSNLEISQIIVLHPGIFWVAEVSSVDSEFHWVNWGNDYPQSFLTGCLSPAKNRIHSSMWMSLTWRRREGCLENGTVAYWILFSNRLLQSYAVGNDYKVSWVVRTRPYQTRDHRKRQRADHSTYLQTPLVSNQTLHLLNGLSYSISPTVGRACAFVWDSSKFGTFWSLHWLWWSEASGGALVRDGVWTVEQL